MAFSKKEKELFKDEKWRLEHLFKIRNKQGQVIPFKLNKPQKMLEDSPKGRNFVIKARQKGISTYYGIKYLNRACFRRNYTAALISHDRESIERIFRPIRFAYERMADRIKPEVDKGGGSKYHLYFPETNSRIYVSLEVVSEAITDLHVSEYALMKNKDRFSRSVDAVALNGDISIETTPRGMNFCYSDWRDPEFPFQKHLFPWYIDQEYHIPLNGQKIKRSIEESELVEKALEQFNIKLNDEQILWRRDKIRTKGRDSFYEEFLEDDVSCFLASGDSVLDLFYIRDLVNNLDSPIDEVNGIRLYGKPESKEIYVCGADTAGGDGGDYNVGTIYRVSDMKQMAQFRSNKIRPAQFATKLVELCNLFKVRGKLPLLGVERNNHGHAVLLALYEIEKYPNLYSAQDDKLGWNTTSLTRPILIDTFIEAFESRTLKPMDKNLLNECLTLVNNNGKIEASEGEHDDTIMASAIAIQMVIREKPKLLYENVQENFLL